MGRQIGSLFSGAGGLDLAVQGVFGGEVVWHAEIDKAASKVLAYRFPGVPNLGDISAVDWAEVPAVDVLCGGFPCQDVSAAGKRAGIKAGTRSGLWSVFADAIDELRPRWVVIENVRGLLSATAHRTVDDADGDVEPAAGVMGDGGGRPVLRAAGAVLGDLADLGYDAQWATVAAADVGAPHRRERVFIVASSAHAKGNGRDEGRPEPAGLVGGFDAAVSGVESGVALLPTPTAQCAKHGAESRFGGGNGDVSNLWQIAHLLPTPRNRDGKGATSSRSGDNKHDLPSALAAAPDDDSGEPELWPVVRNAIGYEYGRQRGNGPSPMFADDIDLDGLANAATEAIQDLPSPLRAQGKADSTGKPPESGLGSLLPTPTSRDHKGRNQRNDETCLTGALLPTPNAQDVNGGGRYSSPGHQSTLPGEARLLCAPSASDGAGGKTSRSGGRIDEPLLVGQAREMASAWGKYEPAIRRWESIVGPAPAPTEPNKNGNPRLSAAFSEWLMGWPQGWVTHPDIGISRNDQLRIIGNGVCPQQATLALQSLLAVSEVTA